MLNFLIKNFVKNSSTETLQIHMGTRHRGIKSVKYGKSLNHFYESSKHPYSETTQRYDW